MQGLISILFQNPALFLIIALALLLSVSVHEFSHAWVANRLGDSTAKDMGRLTLNPLAHVDPLGLIVLLLLGFGWGKPVPVNYYNLKSPKRDAALISLAGPGSNFILALIMAILFHVLNIFLAGIGQNIVYFLILYNLFLGVFNLLPIEPLDGFKIVNGILPPSLSVQWVQLAPYGIFILLFLVATNAVSRIISPVISLLMTLLGVF